MKLVTLTGAVLGHDLHLHLLKSSQLELYLAILGSGNQCNLAGDSICNKV